MTVNRRDLINLVCMTLGTQNYVLLDDFESNVARHICHGGKKINLLQRELLRLPISTNGYDIDGCLNVDYFLCRNCGKLFLNKQSLSIVQERPNQNQMWL